MDEQVEAALKEARSMAGLEIETNPERRADLEREIERIDRKLNER